MREYDSPSHSSNRVLLIDNHDSFTFNIVQQLLQLDASVTVCRNDETAHDPLITGYTHLLISPGPGGPEQTGNAAELVHTAAGRIPVLGVCLGHQLLATLYGGSVGRVSPVHGKCDTVTHNNTGLHRGLPGKFTAARYHSLAVLSCGDLFEVTATGSGGTMIMGLRHRQLPAVEGVQYHPESFMTPAGIELFRRFLNIRTDSYE